MSDDEFENQLQQEAEEKERIEKLKGKQKVDPDGTVYDWDEEKKAWFPKVDADFIAKYQMSYGAEVSTTESTESKAPDPSDPAYAEWYHKYYSNYDGTKAIDTNSKEYREWYEYYYGNHAESKEAQKEGTKSSESTENKDSEDKSEDSGEPPEKKACVEGAGEGEEGGHQSYEEYYAYYYQQYGQPPSTGEEEGAQSEEVKLDPSHPDYWEQYHRMQSIHTPETAVIGENKEGPDADGSKTETETGKKGKKKGPPQPVVPPSWFEMEEEKNTSVYVAGLPPEYTEDQFVTLMNKCGLIMYDPRTKKPKVKLYKDKDGNNKGDGRCCYIKQESVQLALQFLDGSDVDGYKINVEVAKFELKGKYDPSKKKKKLSNAEKKKFKEKQAKLFDWRPDKPRGTREKHEKVVIIKNFFNPEDFNTNPALMNELSQDLREECGKFGEVKKVTIYDRHPDGVASVAFKEAEEADGCVSGLDRRYFAGRRLLAETWDGKAKYEVQETEEEKKERLAKWERFLQQGGGEGGKEGGGKGQEQKGEQGGTEGGAVQATEVQHEGEESGASS